MAWLRADLVSVAHVTDHQKRLDPSDSWVSVERVTYLQDTDGLVQHRLGVGGPCMVQPRQKPVKRVTYLQDTDGLVQHRLGVGGPCMVQHRQKPVERVTYLQDADGLVQHRLFVCFIA